MNKKIINKTNKREKNINIINKLTRNLNQVKKIKILIMRNIRKKDDYN